MEINNKSTSNFLSIIKSKNWCTCLKDKLIAWCKSYIYMHTSRQCLSTFWEGRFSIDSFTFHGGRFCHNKITQYHFHSISFSFMSIAKITCYLIPFSALRKFSLRNTYTCITNNYSIYMVIISMLYYLIKTIFINNWNICIKVKNEVNPWLLTCTVLR